MVRSAGSTAQRGITGCFELALATRQYRAQHLHCAEMDVGIIRTHQNIAREPMPRIVPGLHGRQISWPQMASRIQDGRRDEP